MKVTNALGVLLLWILGFFANAEEESKPDSPAAAVASYYEALKKDSIDEAKSLTAKFEKIPAEMLAHYTAKYSEGAKGGSLTMSLVPESLKIIEDCAVVTFKDGNKDRPDYDPAYLIKQEGKWKVLLKLTQWNHPMFTLSDEQKKRFTELEKWFKEEKKRLYGQ